MSSLKISGKEVPVHMTEIWHTVEENRSMPNARSALLLMMHLMINTVSCVFLTPLLLISRLFSCMVILEMSGSVDICSLNESLQELIDSNADITNDRPLTRMS